MMDKEDVLRKIRSLLSIADKGSNATDNEIQVALLKSRELMAKYNLTMTEVGTGESGECSAVDTGITYNTRYSKWKVPLAMMLAENHRCKAIQTHLYGKQSKIIKFVGDDENPTLLSEVFVTIVRLLESRIYAIHDNLSILGVPAEYKYVESDSYVYGFIEGMRQHYEDQTRRESDNPETGMSLMVTEPESVSKFLSTLSTTEIDTRPGKTLNQSTFNEGYRDGFMYHKKRIGEGE